jgi:hypothetical protein
MSCERESPTMTPNKPTKKKKIQTKPNPKNHKTKRKLQKSFGETKRRKKEKQDSVSN